MTEFGHDIDEEILLRLEANDLIRCKSVCKSWYSLISSDRFVKSQLKYTHRKKVDNNEIGDTRIIALGATSICKYGYMIERRYEWEVVVGSSNGLVCVSYYSEYFLVINPTTREVKKLRHPPSGYMYSRPYNVSGFGYDSTIDDYKVVIGFRNKDSNKFVFEVLTFKSNVWRSLAIESDYAYFSGNGILYNGAIHWFRKKEQVIVSFDISKEVLKETPLPKLGDQDGSWTLGTIKDRLCVFRFQKENGELEIWVMRNDNVHVPWERRIPRPGYDAPKATIHYCPQKRIFSGHHAYIWMLEGSCAPVLVGRIVRSGYDPWYRCYAHHIHLSAHSECNYNYNHHVFLKSLVSPQIKRLSYMEALLGL